MPNIGLFSELSTRVILFRLGEDDGAAFSIVGGGSDAVAEGDLCRGRKDAAWDRFSEVAVASNGGRPDLSALRAGEEPTPYPPGGGLSAKRAVASFSVTSGTIFASRKLAFVDLLGAIALFVNAAKGLSALQLSRCVDVSYKTAFVLAHKLREALSFETQALVLDKTVEIDGAYVGGHVRPANARADRVDRRLRAHRAQARRSVVALRQRDGRILTEVFGSEADGVVFARTWPHIVVADETPHWDLLGDTFDLERINHSDAYSFLGGIHVENGTEAFRAAQAHDPRPASSRQSKPTRRLRGSRCLA